MDTQKTKPILNQKDSQGKNSKSKPKLLLEARNISQRFDYQLFSNINLSLREGESIAIIGPSGSGKSTLLHILSSLLSPLEGEVFFGKKDIYSLDKKELLEIRRDFFGIIFQAHYLFRGFSANENLKIAQLISGNDVDDGLIQKLQIQKVMAQDVGELSGGQQQRLSIARVLTKRPKILFADEPSGNLDKDTANDVMDVLFDYVKELKNGMVLVTHERDIAFRCDRVYQLKDYKLEKLKGE